MNEPHPGGEQGLRECALTCPPELAVPALAARLEAALGTDPWAVGHRSAALAVIASIVDMHEIDAFAASSASAHREAIRVLRRYVADRQDIEGYSTS